MPPPVEARILRDVRPLTLTLMAAHVSREIEHNSAAKAQNVRIEAVFQEIGDLKTKAAGLDARIKICNQMVLDAIEAGDPTMARLQTLAARALGDQLIEIHQLIGVKSDEGLRLEAEDVRREFQRGHEAGIRHSQIVQLRRRQPDGWRPGPDDEGPGAA